MDNLTEAKRQVDAQLTARVCPSCGSKLKHKVCQQNRHCGIDWNNTQAYQSAIQQLLGMLGA